MRLHELEGVLQAALAAELYVMTRPDPYHYSVFDRHKQTTEQEQNETT